VAVCHRRSVQRHKRSGQLQQPHAAAPVRGACSITGKQMLPRDARRELACLAHGLHHGLHQPPFAAMIADDAYSHSAPHALVSTLKAAPRSLLRASFSFIPTLPCGRTSEGSARRSDSSAAISWLTCLRRCLFRTAPPPRANSHARMLLFRRSHAALPHTAAGALAHRRTA
jgi:hypothetical protein